MNLALQLDARRACYVYQRGKATPDSGEVDPRGGSTAAGILIITTTGT